MNATEKQLGELIDRCSACRIPIKGLTGAATHDYLLKQLSFCSEKCLKMYIDDPAKFSEFVDDEELEA